MKIYSDILFYFRYAIAKITERMKNIIINILSKTAASWRHSATAIVLA